MSDTSSRQSKNKSVVKTADRIETEKTSSVGEALYSLGADTVKKSSEAFSEIGKGLFEQLMGLSEQAEKQQKEAQVAEERKPKKIERSTLFNYTEMQERRQISEIQQLLKQIKQEVEQIKHADASMMSEIKDIDNLTIMSIPEKPGIYHIRILEVFLKLLRSVKAKISESSMWLGVARGKKSGGTLFMARSKKFGSNYANSAEHSIARGAQ